MITLKLNSKKLELARQNSIHIFKANKIDSLGQTEPSSGRMRAYSCVPRATRRGRQSSDETVLLLTSLYTTLLIIEIKRLSN